MPVIALLTDFGDQDHYVGALRGAILTVCPEAVLVDVVHGLPPHDVLSGAFSLAAAYRYFPAGAIFVAVVDPGVGSARRGVAFEAGGRLFVGPDNGIFTLVLDRERPRRLYELANAELFRPEVSATFHARDVFGPVAGALARGTRLEEVGPVLKDPARVSIEPVRALSEREWEGAVLHVDRFGNLVTTVSERELDGILRGFGSDPAQVVVVVEGEVMPLTRTYADVAEGQACAVVGSSGYMEVAVHRGSAARILGASRGAPVRLRKAAREAS